MAGRSVFVVCCVLCVIASSSWARQGVLSDTGQTLCYDAVGQIPCPEPGGDFYGQDARYRGAAPSYTKLDNAGRELDDAAPHWVTVRDNVTGLVWEVKTRDGSIHDTDRTFTREEAQGDFIAALNRESFGGFSDWRMPSVKELAALIDRSAFGPAVRTDYFPHTSGLYYWSATPGTEELGSAWLVFFLNGNVTREYRWQWYRVRAVRGEERVQPLADNGNGTVTDPATGLVWQQATAGPMTWKEALAYCEDLSLAGQDDWRLPSVTELHSIVEYGSRGPSADTVRFPGTESAYYWSSTTYVWHTDAAWVVSFNDGDVNDNNKSYSYYVRAVRSR